MFTGMVHCGCVSLAKGVETDPFQIAGVYACIGGMTIFVLIGYCQRALSASALICKVWCGKVIPFYVANHLRGLQ